MENKLEQIHDEEMMHLLKQGLNSIKTQNDSLYIMPSEFYSGVENTTQVEEEISNYILSLIGSSKNDEELIEFNIRPFELWDLIVNFQRLIISKLNSNNTPPEPTE